MDQLLCAVRRRAEPAAAGAVDVAGGYRAGSQDERGQGEEIAGLHAAAGLRDECDHGVCLFGAAGGWDRQHSYELGRESATVAVSFDPRCRSRCRVRVAALLVGLCRGLLAAGFPALPQEDFYQDLIASGSDRPRETVASGRRVRGNAIADEARRAEPLPE